MSSQATPPTASSFKAPAIPPCNTTDNFVEGNDIGLYFAELKPARLSLRLRLHPQRATNNTVCCTTPRTGNIISCISARVLLDLLQQQRRSYVTKQRRRQLHLHCSGGASAFLFFPLSYRRQRLFMRALKTATAFISQTPATTSLAVPRLEAKRHLLRYRKRGAVR